MVNAKIWLALAALLVVVSSNDKLVQSDKSEQDFFDYEDKVEANPSNQDNGDTLGIDKQKSVLLKNEQTDEDGHEHDDMKVEEEYEAAAVDSDVEVENLKKPAEVASASTVILPKLGEEQVEPEANASGEEDEDDEDDEAENDDEDEDDEESVESDVNELEDVAGNIDSANNGDPSKFKETSNLKYDESNTDDTFEKLANKKSKSGGRFNLWFVILPGIGLAVILLVVVGIFVATKWGLFGLKRVPVVNNNNQRNNPIYKAVTQEQVWRVTSMETLNAGWL